MDTGTISGLTEREAAVIDALIRTGSNKGAARMVGIGVKTVETHLNRARRKADVHCALHLAMRFAGFVYPAPAADPKGAVND